MLSGRQTWGKPSEVLADLSRHRDFGFALPKLPCLNGREFVGTVVAVNVPTGCRLAVGDQVHSYPPLPSTPPK